MRWQQITLLALSGVMLSGCPPARLLKMAPATYLGLVADDQCFAKTDPELRRRGMSAWGTKEEHILWQQEIARCHAIRYCIETKLFTTGDFDYDDWPIIDDFYDLGYDTKNAPEIMLGRIASDNTEALKRFEVFSKAATACRK